MGGPLGTLIVVVLKARNLPNKQRIGKQDPYATCTYLSHRKRTKTDKRGGQHPVWDDELRFEIYENAKDAMASVSVSTTATGGVVPLKPNSSSVASTGTAGVKELHVAVYADDPRDPDFIGEGKVDLTDTLKKGEFDDWVTVTNKGKYQGEIYLEMTFYSAKPPPEKLKTPTGQIRAGVFESTSPGSGLRPSGTGTPGSLSNLGKSASPSPSPARKIAQDSVPTALRASRPMSGPTSTGQLPLPGEPSSSKDVTLNSRQRSTGSLSIPTSEFGLSHHSHSRSPSRNHSLDPTNHLIASINALSLSGRSTPGDQVYFPQPQHTELQAPHHPTHQRPHRHSFSGHSNDYIQEPHSTSSSAYNPEISGDHFHDPANPSFVNQSYPDHFSASSQPHRAPRPSLAPRRPLPIPGGDNVHRPPSAWGNTQHGSSSGQVYANEGAIQFQPPQPSYAAYPDDLERHQRGIQGIPNGTNSYPPSASYPGSHHLPNGIHPPNVSNQPYASYSEQTTHYPPPPPATNPPFSPNQHSGHLPFNNLPPPPPGQAPVPIHEVFASSTSRPFHPPTAQGGFPPQANFAAQSQLMQSSSRPTSSGGGVYAYPNPPLDRVQHHNQAYNPPMENTSLDNCHQLQNPPPPHQLSQYQSYHPQPVGHNMVAPVQPAPPPSQQLPQVYYQSTYVPSPSSTPAPVSQQPHAEYNNPFHIPSPSVPTGIVNYRPPPSTPPHPHPHPHPSHGQPVVPQSVTFYTGYHSYPQS